MRNGFSLMEVLIATAILMGSAVVLSRLAGMGREQALKARTYAECQWLCENTLNEVLLGMRPPEPVESVPLLPVVSQMPALSEGSMVEPSVEPSGDNADPLSIPETPAAVSTESTDGEPLWRYSLQTEPLPDVPGLWSITVSVMQGDPALPRPVRVSLTRWLSGPATQTGLLPTFDSMSGEDSLPGADDFSSPFSEDFGGR